MGIDQTSEVYIVMTSEGVFKIVNFKTPGAGVIMLGCCHVNHIVKMQHFFTRLEYYGYGTKHKTIIKNIFYFYFKHM